MWRRSLQDWLRRIVARFGRPQLDFSSIATDGDRIEAAFDQAVVVDHLRAGRTIENSDAIRDLYANIEYNHFSALLRIHGLAIGADLVTADAIAAGPLTFWLRRWKLEGKNAKNARAILMSVELENAMSRVAGREIPGWLKRK